MALGRNKNQSRENRARVRKVLTREWDPIGVRDVPQGQDEYDSYVGTVYLMLMGEQATPVAIATYLFDTATGHMGLSPSRELAECCTRTADVLFGLRRQFGLHQGPRGNKSYE